MASAEQLRILLNGLREIKNTKSAKPQKFSVDFIFNSVWNLNLKEFYRLHALQV